MIYRSLVVLTVIAILTAFGLGSSDANTKKPGGTCTTSSCEYVLDNVPPNVTGGAQTLFCESDPAKQNEWHFVLTRLGNSTTSGVTAPTTITAVFQTAGGQLVAIDANKTVDDPEVGYTLSTNLSDTLLGAIATINGAPGTLDADTWPGNFVLSHAPCGVSVTTQIHAGTDHATEVLSVPAGTIVHDKATVTGAPLLGTPTGNVTFTFFPNHTCTPSAQALNGGTVALVATVPPTTAVADPSTAFGPLAAGFYSFKARYNGDATHAPADGPCEPLEVLSLRVAGELRACKYEDANANGVKDPLEPPLAGWAMTISPVDPLSPEPATQTTDATGCVLWTNLAPGDYTVTEAAPAGGLPWFNTDPGNAGPCLMSGASDAGFTLCPSAPQKSATVTAGTTAQVIFGNLQSAQKHGQKFYDFNLNGLNDDSKVVAGVKITLTGKDVGGFNIVPIVDFTDVAGNYSFVGLLPGEYTVTETVPQGSWLPTTATFKVFGLDAGEKEEHNDFGNICLGPGGGKTLGFWSNKNGEAQINDGNTMAPELALLVGLNLRNATGANFDPANYGQFRTWILGATATNMAYMLSAQLAAMTLNVEAGFVTNGGVVYAPGCGNTGPGNNFITIGALTFAANATLGADGFTPDGDPLRASQECLKNALDKANNNLNFVQANACPVSYPAP